MIDDRVGRTVSVGEMIGEWEQVRDRALARAQAQEDFLRVFTCGWRTGPTTPCTPAGQLAEPMIDTPGEPVICPIFGREGCTIGQEYRRRMAEAAQAAWERECQQIGIPPGHEKWFWLASFERFEQDPSPAIVAAQKFMDGAGRCGGCLLLLGSNGVGKAQPLDAKILTPTGWTEMRRLKVGDAVIAGDGTATQVTGVFPQGERQVYRVRFSDGSSTRCCGEHLWAVTSFTDRRRAERRSLRRQTSFLDGAFRYQTVSTETLRAAVSVRFGQRNYRNYRVPQVGPVAFERQPVPIDPYVLGVLLGDGCLQGNSIRFSSADAEIVNEVSRLVAPNPVKRVGRSTYDYSITGVTHGTNEILNRLRSLGCIGRSYNKSVPEIYKLNGREERLALLQGLMDTDGETDPRESWVGFSTTSPLLAADVTFLVQSLGGVVRQRSKIPTYTHKGERRKGRRSYCLTISLPPEMVPFRLSRKRRRSRPKTQYQPARFVISVEEDGLADVQCIQVSHPSQLYVTDDMIVTHNTTAAVAACREARGRRVFVYVPSLVTELLGDGKAAALEQVKRADFLVLDNLGADYLKAGGVMESHWDTIFWFREAHRLTTIATSRLMWDPFQARLTVDIRDRLKGWATLAEVPGESFRGKK